MKEIITRLYECSLRIDRRRDEEQAALNRQYSALEQEFRKTLTPEQLEQFSRLSDLNDKISAVTCQNEFAAGLRMGGKILITTLAPTENA